MRARTLVPLLLFAACDESSTPPPAARDAAADAPYDAADAADAIEAPDAQSPDAQTPDAVDAPVDAPVDAAPAAPRTCTPCLYDDQCGAGGRCVDFDPATFPGVRMCAVACGAVGEACDAPVPSICQTDDVSGDPVCVPVESCVPMSSRRNLACPADGCVGRYSVCADLDRTDGVRGRAGTVCLPPCARDSDCEDGMRRCLPVRTREGAAARACVPDDRAGPDACAIAAVNALGIGRPCDAATACAAPLACLTLDPALHAFCTSRCATDADCGGGGARCLSAGAQGMRCVPEACACGAAPGDTLLDRALAQGTPPWSRCNLHFAVQNVDAFGPNVTRDRFRLPVFERVHRDWAYGVRWSRDLGPALDAAAVTLSGALAASASLRADRDGATRAIAVPAPVPAPPSGDDDARAALVDALSRAFTQGGRPADRAALTTAAQGLPGALAGSVARILTASVDAARARDAGLALAPTAAQRQRLFATGPFLFLPTNRVADRPDFTRALDLGSLQGDVTLPVPEALRLAATIEAIDWAPLRAMMGPSLDVDTPMGRVVVRDGAAHRYARDAYARTLLVIDLGGDDTYENQAAANVDVDNPVSVNIDLGGDDSYGYEPSSSPLDNPMILPSDTDGRLRVSGGPVPSMSRQGRQGSARLGVALLYDLGSGADHYRSLRLSQGFAAYGVGGLYDDGGADEYSAEAGSQGAAAAGVAALVDAGGADRYTAWAFAQGFAYVQGAGLLYDRDGSDVYDSKLAPVLYGSPQDMTVNSSFTQGAGFGRRADGTADHVNMAGGLGMLRDRAGDDRYSTAIFGQGTGYWSGLGLLLDGAGDDRYDGRWYVQGGAAHFAFAALVDGGGRDVHNMDATRQNMTAGAGHDFSLGILLSLGAGDDVFHVPNLALGAGNANGAGIFVEEGGADTYDAASALTLGNAALESLTDPGRLMRPTVGVFLDGDGVDTYRRPMPGPEGNDRVWTQRIHMEAPLERGFGADGTRSPIGF